MGFRNPITTANDVDTGPTPTGPGVRLYQAGGTGPLDPAHGVLEYRDGVAGDRHATISRKINTFDQGDGSLTVFGGSWTLDAGTVNGLEVGKLIFDVREKVSGGFESVIELEAPGRFTMGAVCEARATSAISWGTGWATMPLQAVYDTHGAWDGTTGRWWFIAPEAGDYAIEGIAQMGSLVAGAYIGARIAINGAVPLASPGQVFPTGAAGSASALTGRKRYPLLLGDRVALQAYSDRAAATRHTPSDGITSYLLIERVG